MRTRTAPGSAHTRVGRWGEDIALAVLTSGGYSLLERNWRPAPVPGIETVRGEVDLVMVDPEMNLVFVEVKTRSTEAYGHPFEAITGDKGRRLRFLAYAWAAREESGQYAGMRVDAVAVCGSPRQFSFEHRLAVV